MTIILGIDPGLQKTGWGVIDSFDNRMRFIACGAIHTDSKADLALRLLTLHEGIREVVELYHPDSAAIEETFVNKNPVSSLKLGHARGTLMLSVSISGIEIKEYAATMVKKSIVGVGRAEKNQVMTMVKHLLPTAKIASEDAADALAVAICHANHYHFKSYVGA